MKSLKALITLCSIITIFTFSNCEVKEIECPKFDQRNLIFSLSMFQNPDSVLYYIGESDTLILKKWYYGFNEPYIERCGVYPNPNCYCYGTFDGSFYLNDSIFFRTQIRITTPEEKAEVGIIDFDFNIDKFRYGTYQISNSMDSIKSFIDKNIVESLTVNDFQFHNVLDVAVSNHKSVDRVIIKKNVGIVAIVYKKQLFNLKR